MDQHLRNTPEADQEDVRLAVGERSQTVVVLLSSRVPHDQVDGRGRDVTGARRRCHLDNLRLHDGRHVRLWEGALGDHVEHGGFAGVAVAHNDHLAAGKCCVDSHRVVAVFPGGYIIYKVVSSCSAHCANLPWKRNFIAVSLFSVFRHDGTL